MVRISILFNPEKVKFIYLLQIIRAPITPGTHAQSVSRKTMSIDPQPLSITANGGKIIHKITRHIDISNC